MLMDRILRETRDFTERMPKQERKAYGQFFTGADAASFMAGLFDIDPSRPVLRILDAGAGSGILRSALTERIRHSGYAGRIELACYESDPAVLPLLRRAMDALADECGASCSIRAENYLTSQDFGNGDGDGVFDLVIGNPPYRKLNKASAEARHMASVCDGAPNLYFLFMAMGVRNLQAGGQLAYIIPRSWTSGAYFARFREYLLSRCAIERIHLFKSRGEVFKGDPVLQETMIIKARKTSERPRRIEISCSGTPDFANTSSCKLGYGTIVGADGCVYLAQSHEDEAVLEKLRSLGSTLGSNGLRMKTGLVVRFRERGALRSNGHEGAIPLLGPQHIRNSRVTWPLGKDDEFIIPSRGALAQENADYVLVKRFTSKEERRRLQCALWLAGCHPGCSLISTDNKLNFIRCGSEDEAFGIPALLSSSIYDRYYRILNGSTQVNATEVNAMPFPPEDVIARIGKEIRSRGLSERNCDVAVNKWIDPTRQALN